MFGFILSSGGPRCGKQVSMTSLKPILHLGQASGLMLSLAEATSLQESVVFSHKGCPRSSLALLRSVALFVEAKMP